MRSNRKFSFRERLSALRKVIINQFSLFYLKLFNSCEVILVRDGGLGDAIMCLGIVERLKREYPNADFKVSSNYPIIFQGYKFARYHFLKFPVLWLTYGHYDMKPWKSCSNIHYINMMANAVGLVDQTIVKPYLELNDLKFSNLMEEYGLHQNYIVIQPFAGKWFREKNWTQAKWNLLVKALSEKNINVFQIGTLDEPRIEGSKDLRNLNSIEQTLFIIKNANLLIGVNSFAEQAGHMYKIPGVFLYGPTNPICSLNPGQLAVYSDQVKTYEEVQGIDYSFYSMNEIEVETVIKALDRINLEDHA